MIAPQMIAPQMIDDLEQKWIFWTKNDFDFFGLKMFF